MNELVILDDSDKSIIESLKDELVETREKSQIFRTRTEMEVSVLNDTYFPTHASKYWQAMREQNVHFNELAMLSFEYRKNEVECKKLKRQIENEEDDLERELLEIELEKTQYIMTGQQKAAKGRVREILNWSDIKQREAKYMTDVELADVDVHQLISYTKRWIKQMIDMGTNGSPSEMQNLLGQLRAGITACIRNGIINQVLIDFPESIQKQICNEYSIPWQSRLSVAK